MIPSVSIILAIDASPVYGVIGALILLLALILRPIACVTLAACAGATTAVATHGNVSIGKAIAVGIGVGAAISIAAGMALLVAGSLFPIVFLFPVFSAIIYYGLPIVITSRVVTSMAGQPAATSQKSLLGGIKGGIIFALIGIPFNLVGHPTFGALGALLGPLVIATSAIVITLVSIRRMRRAARQM